MIERIDFVTLGPFAEGLALDLVARTSRRLPFPCRLAHRETETPRSLEGRGQADADAMLAGLEALATEAGTILLGLTALDVGSPLFTFFFGRARLGGRAGFVSTARLSPTFYGLPEDAATTRRRAEVEILHELGHVLGLPHCADFGCLMHVTTNVEGLDARGTSYCPSCRERLPAEARP